MKSLAEVLICSHSRLTSASKHPNKVELANRRLLHLGGIKNRVQTSKAIRNSGSANDDNNAVVVSKVDGATVGTFQIGVRLTRVVRFGEKPLGEA